VIAKANVIPANPSNYQSLLRTLQPGDMLLLAAGTYNGSSTPGLPISNLHGTAAQPIIISGPESGARPVLIGDGSHNTIQFNNASHIIVRNIEVDARDTGGEGVNAKDNPSHHITLENLVIRGVGGEQAIIGISTKVPVWDWVIRGCEIYNAGTGIYLGNSDGNEPFVRGLIENNLIVDTLGYNLQIKHQNPRPTVAGMPTGVSQTIIRHNVFSKARNGATGSARPNLLIGHLPRSGAGASDSYLIYGNFFYQNPTEALFQGEGNIAFYNNVLLNDGGDAINIQPHNDVPKMIRVFHNTIVASGTGIRISGGAGGFTQKAIGNAVFAGSPIAASDAQGNITGAYNSAANVLNNPRGSLANGTLDLFPRAGQLSGPALAIAEIDDFSDWNLDFNGVSHASHTIRGGYAGQGQNPGWTLALQRKVVDGSTPTPTPDPDPTPTPDPDPTPTPDPDPTPTPDPDPTPSPTPDPDPSPTPTPDPDPTPTPTPDPDPTPTPDPDPTPGSGDGLSGTYYNRLGFKGASVSRVDATIDFEWGKSRPHPDIRANSYSVRWQGEIEATQDEVYTFYANSDDGVRVWVNGERIIRDWKNHAARESSGKIALEAGKRYPIKIEYKERRGVALMQLFWESASTPKQIVPQSQLYTGSAVADPVADLVVTDLTAASGTAYRLATLANKAALYVDRKYSWRDLPAELPGLPYIQTANNDKSADGSDFLSFTVDRPVTVWVAYDVRLNRIPAWLSDWQTSGRRLKTTDFSNRMLFSKDFPAGTVTLGANEGRHRHSMYSVILMAQEDDS
jgi:hypothetical protein